MMEHTTIVGAWFVIAVVFLTVMSSTIVKAARTIYPKNRRPPPPVANGAPLVGVLPSILTKSLQSVIHEQYLKLGNVFTLWSFGLKVTFLVGPEVSEHFFHARDSEMSMDDVYKITIPITGRGVGYDVDTDTRKDQNRFFAEALRPAKLRSHVDSMVNEVEEFFARWGQSGTVDLQDEVDRLLMLISSRCLLGKEVRENMFDEVFFLFHELMGGLHLISMFFPYLPIPAHRRRDRARARLDEIFTGVVRSRKNSGRAESDMLQHLIDSKYKDGRSTTEAEVTGLLVALLFFGHHASSTGTAWTVARLLSHPGCRDAAAEEQRQLIERHGDCIDYNILLQMDFLHRCIKESLRLHPVTPVMLRRARRAFTVRAEEGVEYEVPEGRLVASPLVVNNLLPGIYKDPQMFDPDRFAPGREEDMVGGDLAYTSFGAGMHSCMGEGYAYLQMKVILSHLLRNFELELISPFPETENMISMRPKGIVRYKRRLMHHSNEFM